MTGEIVMLNKRILSTVDPINGRHLTRKSYVDNQDAKKLSLTGRTMTGDINMGDNKIIENTDPTDDTHLTRKKYVDTIKKDVGFSILKDNFSLKFHNLFFVEYNSIYDLLFSRNGGDIKEWFDYGIEGLNFKQTTNLSQPSLCLESGK